MVGDKGAVSAGVVESYGDSGIDLTYLGKNGTHLYDVQTPSWMFNRLDVNSILSITNINSGDGWINGLYTIVVVGDGQGANANKGVATLDRNPTDPNAQVTKPAAWLLNPGVPANALFQELDGREAMLYAARGMNITHRAFFSSDVKLSTRHRLTWGGLPGGLTTGNNAGQPNNGYLRVHAYYKRGRPGDDLLWVAELELVTTRMETAGI